MSETRVFFVTDSKEDNEELHETLEQAQAYTLSAMSDPSSARIKICLVLDAFKDGDRWNYEDTTSAFQTIRVLDEPF